MDLMHIPLTELKPSPRPMSAMASESADYKDLIPSIKERGILQPLLVRPTWTKAMRLLQDRRRFPCRLRTLEKEGLPPVEAVPCAVMAKGDDAEAVEASLIENVAHLPMDEMDQFEAFQRLLKEGRSVEDIAHIFGVTELTVKRRLAIANLAPKIRQLYRIEDIDAETLRALTMASKQQQKDWLSLYEDEDQQAPMGQGLKRWLLGGQNISTKNALFDLATYQGEIVSDLFGEESYFANPDGFWALQDKAIEAKREAYLAQGWTRVEIMPRGDRFHEWDFEKTAKKKGGAIFITASERGEVELHEGYLSRTEARKREKQDTGQAEPPKAAKPELTAPMQNYVDLHRLASCPAGTLEPSADCPSSCAGTHDCRLKSVDGEARTDESGKARNRGICCCQSGKCSL